MSLSSGYSDIALDRIIAREEWYNCQRTCCSLRITKGCNPRDLSAVGALFQLNPKECWPEHLEICDDEGACQQPGAAPKLTKTAHQPSSDPNNNLPEGPPPTSTLTPTQAAPYLTPAELRELERRRLGKQRMRSRVGQRSEVSMTPPRGRSPCTTANGAEEEQAPDQQAGARTPVSTRHTPSHRSFGTIDDENRSAGEGPASPRPWSTYDQTSGTYVVNAKE